MKFYKPEFNFAWRWVKDTDIKRIIISPFHEFIIELKNGKRFTATQLKA